jgi:hypothetical protein
MSIVSIGKSQDNIKAITRSDTTISNKRLKKENKVWDLILVILLMADEVIPLPKNF